MSSGPRIISGKEVLQHNTRESCWIIVHGGQVSAVCTRSFLSWFTQCTGKVYDVTDFLDGTRLMRTKENNANELPLLD